MYKPLSPRLLVALLLLLALAVLATSYLPEYYLYVGCTLMMFFVLAVGLDLLMGWTGQFALAHSAFFAIGCYGTALLHIRLGLPFILAMPISAVVASAIGLLVGWPATRMRNIYLSLATFAFAESVRWVLNSWDSVTGGPNGIRIATFDIFGFAVVNAYDAFPVIACIFFVMIVVTLYLTRSRVGAEMLAVRESEHVAFASGININRVKLKAFALSAVYASVAGSLFALMNSFANPDQFGFGTSIIVLSMIVVGGMGTIPGVMIGVVLIGLLPEFLRSALRSVQVWQELIYGLILIAAMMFMPRGVWGAIKGILPSASKAKRLALTQPLERKVGT